MTLSSKLGTENSVLALSLTLAQPVSNNFEESVSGDVGLAGTPTPTLELQPPLESLVIVEGLVQQGGNAIIYVGRRKTRELTVNTTLDSLDEVILCSETLTVTLPLAVNLEGKVYQIKNISSAGTVTIQGTSSQTIDGLATVELTADDAVTLVGYNFQWYII